eukprot:60236_1
MCLHQCSRLSKIRVYKPSLRSIRIHTQTFKPIHHFSIDLFEEFRVNDIIQNNNNKHQQNEQIEHYANSQHLLQPLITNLESSFATNWCKYRLGMHLKKSDSQLFGTQIMIDQNKKEFVACVIEDNILQTLIDAQYQDLSEFDQHLNIMNQINDLQYNLVHLLWNMVTNKKQPLWECKIYRHM